MLHTVFIIIFVLQTLSWCQRVVRISRNRENLTAIESTTTTTMANLILYHGVRLVVKSREEFTVIKLTQHFKRLFERTLNIQTSSETIRYDHSILEM